MADETKSWRVGDVAFAHPLPSHGEGTVRRALVAEVCADGRKVRVEYADGTSEKWLVRITAAGSRRKFTCLHETEGAAAESWRVLRAAWAAGDPPFDYPPGPGGGMTAEEAAAVLANTKAAADESGAYDEICNACDAVVGGRLAAYGQPTAEELNGLACPICNNTRPDGSRPGFRVE